MNAPRPITLTIDSKPCQGFEGQTILEVASAHGITIPTLCHLKGLTPLGGCRVCIVEIEGSPKLVPSCATPATHQSKVLTQSERVQSLRRVTLELLFSERNHNCPFCPSNKGDCELQSLAYRAGMDSVRYPFLYPGLPVDLSGRYFGLDHNRCVLCARCVRACDEVEGIHTLDIANRGAKNQILVDGRADFGSSETCTNCGACVAACPTGALFDKYSAFHGQLSRCETVRSTCTECPVGCGVLVYVRDQRVVNVLGDPASSVNRGHLCVRGRYGTWAEPRKRILQPLLRAGQGFRAATWEEAARAIADARRDIAPARRALLVWPRVSRETADAVRTLAPHFGRAGLFLANHEGALCAANEGIKPDLSAVDRADAIVLVGAQPGRDQGVVAARIRSAVRRRGAKLVILNSRKSDLDYYADISANIVTLERSLWHRVGETLAGCRAPLVVYGPQAMAPIGVSVMERLIAVLDSMGEGTVSLLPLMTGPHSLPLAASGLTPVEHIVPWLDEKPTEFLYLLVSDDPTGGASLLKERHSGEWLDGLPLVVAHATYASALTEKAHVILPAAAWGEKNGSFRNLEGRDLTACAAVPPRGESRDDPAILHAVLPA